MRSLALQIEDIKIVVPVFEKEGKSWVALKPLCEALGVSRQKQQEKILKSEFVRWNHMVLPSQGGDQTMLCIEIDCVGEWIFGISPNKVKPEIKERLMLFRRKLQAVLYAAVTGHIDAGMVQSLIREISLMRHEMDALRQETVFLRQENANLRVDMQDLRDGAHHMNSIEASYAGKRLQAQRGLKLVQ